MSLSFIKKLSNVTLPLLKIKENVEYYVTIRKPMAVGKAMPPKPTTDPETGAIKMVTESPATITEVMQYVVNEAKTALIPAGEFQMICSTVFNKELNEAYPDASYVGRTFAFTITKVSGKRYNLVQIAEIEAPKPAAEESSPAANAATETAGADTSAAETAAAPAAPAKGKGK